MARLHCLLQNIYSSEEAEAAEEEAASSSEEAVCGPVPAPAPAAFATGALTPAVVVLHRSAQAGTPGGQPHHQLF